MAKRYKYNEIEQVFSPERMRKYRVACNNDTHKAMTLYRYNLRLSQEMFAVVSYFEVALRNRIAHHEPICFNSKVEKDTTYVRNRHKRMMTLFEWMGLDGEALLYGLDHSGRVWKKIDNL